MATEPDAETPEEASRALGRAYTFVFEMIRDGWNFHAAAVLRAFSPAQLKELHVICGDVRGMIEAEQHRRETP